MMQATRAASSLARRGGASRCAPLLKVKHLSTQPADEPPLLPAPIPSLATATFDYKDPLNISASLTEDELMIYDTARSFAQSELLPGIVEATRKSTFDRGIMRAFGELGLLGLTIPTEYGGASAGYVAYGLTARAVEQVDSGYRSAMSVQSSLVMHPISLFGSDEQKEQWLPQLATGEKVGCFGLTEPDHGSDPSGMATKAVWDPDSREWVLSGSKMWITVRPCPRQIRVTTTPSARCRDASRRHAVRGGPSDRLSLTPLPPPFLARTRPLPTSCSCGRAATPTRGPCAASSSSVCACAARERSHPSYPVGRRGAWPTARRCCSPRARLAVPLTSNPLARLSTPRVASGR